MGSPRFTFEEIVKSMTDLGVPREKAEWQARLECGLPPVARGYAVDTDPVPCFAPDAPSIALPLRFTLPWSALCSDNYHEKASLTIRKGKPFPRKILDARYKAARDKTADIVRGIAANGTPLAQPLALHAMVYVPDERPHDPCNFAKCCLDSLQRIVYASDRWVYDVRWIRAGVDVDAPRAEITVDVFRDNSYISKL